MPPAQVGAVEEVRGGGRSAAGKDSEGDKRCEDEFFHLRSIVNGKIQKLECFV